MPYRPTEEEEARSEREWVHDAGIGPAIHEYYSGTGELEHQAEKADREPAPWELNYDKEIWG